MDAVGAESKWLLLGAHILYAQAAQHRSNTADTPVAAAAAVSVTGQKRVVLETVTLVCVAH